MVNNTQNEEFILKLCRTIKSDRLFLSEPMSKHTTFRIGGPADYLLFPGSVAEIISALTLAQQYSIPVTVVGNGSNMLVLDKGIRGMVLKFGRNMSDIRLQDDRLIVGSGAILGDVSRFAAGNHLKGMEFAVGIPGSIGGAVFMNAGAYDGEMSHVVSAVSAVCLDGTFNHFSHDQLDFGYRHSIFQDNHCIICEVELKLQSGQMQEIEDKMNEYTKKRESKQPVEMPSAGSTFKRPAGNFAGTLIEQAGLKGLKIGGAQVSEKHAGFIINAGGATAQDVLTLIQEVQRRVYEYAGVKLHPEVRILGEE
ncbi:UDP-N-acetylenolpyruvoylglucosamine reductase [Propionispora sp. 2/2-37]|uniref:UDP-N-acetylmuramate dehydrogenase n=1 Tax=Propionispora sp. 2/2-37 TaxID=1677858 RepID=UPI0006BB99D8|nr:UDP-N-acetylmuramate dehydrogenase [Propionispora sp. 2/2-37]CUH96887.1 UDP-N-acetylenolpyruvoylglucosamine reductase [Propionispora sp. 2/2-37]